MWGELCRRVVEHFVQRYSRAEVAAWYFEVWNEPDISYWQGTPEQYFKLYDYSVAGVRKALPEARVGGPGSTGPGGERAITFLTNFLNHCANDKNAATGEPIPLDFISFHPKGSPRYIAATDAGAAHVRMGLSNELTSAANGFRTVAASAKYHDLPIILSEADPEGCAACSAKENPANAYRNGPLYPSYTAAAMKGLLDLAAENKVNLVGMVTWAFEFEGKQYFEGFRTLATNGIDKPVLNVFRMAGLFSGDRIAATSSAAIPVADIVKSGVRAADDIDTFATKSAHEAAVMLWNYHDDDLPAPSAPVTVTISGIPGGVHKVLLEHFRIDDAHSNAFTVWKAMGSPQDPTPEQYAQLKSAGQLQLLTSPEWLDVTAGAVTIPTDLPRQATSFLHLKW
jgi:xylan 1,4-beta-xylosidase